MVVNGADRVAFHGDASQVPIDLAKYIDHTALKPETTAADIDTLCQEAEQYHFAIGVRESDVGEAGRHQPAGQRREGLFGDRLPARGDHRRRSRPWRPAGPSATAPARSTWSSTSARCKSGDHEMVRTDIEKVVDSAHEAGAIVKVIIETVAADRRGEGDRLGLAKKAKADFVKTSTGFSGGGATVYDVALMRETVGPDMGVKASGGVRTASDVEDMIAAGATRIGASAGVQIVEWKRRRQRWRQILRSESFAFLDSLQPQYAAFLGTVAQGFLPARR